MRKAFGGTLAVDDVDVEVNRGEILALLGQNGAGKSTVIKMLAGVYKPDAGTMELDGRSHDPRTDGGISFVHQDLGLVEWMSVAENIAMGQGFRRRRGLIDWSGVDAAARRSLSMIAHDIDPRRRVADLTRTEKSLVAIARALGVDAKVLVLDEPTASLPAGEVELLFSVLRRLKAQGVSMIYVSHRLDEIFAISDCMTVLRDGRVVDSRRTADAEPEALIAAIIGRPPEKVFVRPPAPATAEPVLACEDLTSGDVGPVSFRALRGEIIGLVGLRGAGHEVVGRVLIGDAPADGGRITLGSAPFDHATPTRSIAGGLGFVAGDRVAESVAHGLSVRENMFVNPGAAGRPLFGWRTPASERDETRRFGRSVSLSPNDPEAAIETLSGGNQQKVVVARWMRIGPRVLVLEDPTAGVDVGAKAEIYRLLAEALAGGQSIILVSTDFEEIAAICHRALIFRGGRIVAELPADRLSVESVTRATSLGTADPAQENP
jgi:ribose transport system ATP-binding protein